MMISNNKQNKCIRKQAILLFVLLIIIFGLSPIVNSQDLYNCISGCVSSANIAGCKQAYNNCYDGCYIEEIYDYSQTLAQKNCRIDCGRKESSCEDSASNAEFNCIKVCESKEEQGLTEEKESEAQRALDEEESALQEELARLDEISLSEEAIEADRAIFGLEEEEELKDTPADIGKKIEDLKDDLPKLQSEINKRKFYDFKTGEEVPIATPIVEAEIEKTLIKIGNFKSYFEGLEFATRKIAPSRGDTTEISPTEIRSKLEDLEELKLGFQSLLEKGSRSDRFFSSKDERKIRFEGIEENLDYLKDIDLYVPEDVELVRRDIKQLNQLEEDADFFFDKNKLNQLREEYEELSALIYENLKDPEKVKPMEIRIPEVRPLEERDLEKVRQDLACSSSEGTLSCLERYRANKKKELEGKSSEEMVKVNLREAIKLQNDVEALQSEVNQKEREILGAEKELRTVKILGLLSGVKDEDVRDQEFRIENNKRVLEKKKNELNKYLSQALTYHSEVLGLNPNNLEANIYSAMIYSQMGERDKARALYGGIIKSDVSDPSNKAFIERVKASLQDAARSDLKLAKKPSPESSKFLGELKIAVTKDAPESILALAKGLYTLPPFYFEHLLSGEGINKGVVGA